MVKSSLLRLRKSKCFFSNAVSEYQSSEEMAALKQTLHDEGYKEATEAFEHTMATIHLDWDLAVLGEHLIDQITAWCAEHRATHPPVDECPAAVRPPSPSFEPPEVPPPPPKVHPEQVIEDDPEPAVRAAENNGNVEQIDNPDSVLDR